MSPFSVSVAAAAVAIVVALLFVGPLAVALAHVVVWVVVLPILVVVYALTGRIPSTYCRHVLTLPLSTLLVVVRKAAVVPEIGFPTPVSEITPTANGQKLASLASRFVPPAVAPSELLPTDMASRNLPPHMQL
mgnify:CR=1 FL=1